MGQKQPRALNAGPRSLFGCQFVPRAFVFFVPFVVIRRVRRAVVVALPDLGARARRGVSVLSGALFFLTKQNCSLT